MVLSRSFVRMLGGKEVFGVVLEEFCVVLLVTWSGWIYITSTSVV